MKKGFVWVPYIMASKISSIEMDSKNIGKVNSRYIQVVASRFGTLSVEKRIKRIKRILKLLQKS